MKLFENLKNSFSWKESEKKHLKDLRRYDYR